MRRKKGRSDFDQSEPEFLICYLDRHRDWAVIVCLVGGGQEINQGEAGISAWLDAVREKFSHWQVYVSASLMGSEYQAKVALEQLSGRPKLSYDKGLHLSVSMRVVSRGARIGICPRDAGVRRGAAQKVSPLNADFGVRHGHALSPGGPC